MFCSTTDPSFYRTSCWGNRCWCPEVKFQFSSNRTPLVHGFDRSMLAPLYLAEISPPEVRGSLMALEQFSIVLGVVLGFWTGFMTRDCELVVLSNCLFLFMIHFASVAGASSWRIPLGIQLIPGIILAIGCYYLPSSPRLLILHGKYNEALASLAKLRLRNPTEANGDILLQVTCPLHKPHSGI